MHTYTAEELSKDGEVPPPWWRPQEPPGPNVGFVEGVRTRLCRACLVQWFGELQPCWVCGVTP